MAADGYARVGGGIGAAISTSGPGATNMITGICCAFYDSVPVMFLTGQVATFRHKAETGVRQMGFQETDIVEMARPITKYAAMVTDPSMIRYELEKALWIATTGRPGPVLLDIPDDLQRAQIEPDTLQGFQPEPVDRDTNSGLPTLVDRTIELVRRAERPVAILGWGIRLAGAQVAARALVERLGLPTVLTWGALDLLPSDHPLQVPPIGTHGVRSGNFTVQNADLILAIGTRLDTHTIGSPANAFARQAQRIMVDIDQTEIDKFEQLELKIDLPVVADARAFLELALDRAGDLKLDIGPWRERIDGWKQSYPPGHSGQSDTSHVDPYAFVAALSDAVADDDVIVVDTGCAVAWMSQAFRFKEDQRYLHAFNNTPMGYALPAAIGASLALGGKRVICVTGDGALQMNIQELGTVIRQRLPIKIFLLNNHGYSMIQQTQDQWLGSRYIASSVEGGLAFPDFNGVAAAYGFAPVTIEASGELDGIVKLVESDGPVFCNVEIRPEERVIPQVKFGRPIEDADPLLPRDEFLANMIVDPVDASRS